MSRAQVVLSLAGALVGLVFAVALFQVLGPSSGVSSQLRGYTVSSPGSVQVVFELAREPGTAVTCVLRARGRDGLEVGRRQVDLPPATRRSTVEQVDVPTTARAVTGELVGCREGRSADPVGSTPP